MEKSYENKLDRMDECDRQNIERIQRLEISMAELRGDVKHIKERIDNGMSKTINDIWNKLSGDIIPICNDSKYWVGKLKGGIFWISFTAVFGGIIAIVMRILERKAG